MPLSDTQSYRPPLPGTASSGAVTGAVALLLRLEGGAALVASIVAYHLLGGAWWMFFLLFLAPDLSMAGYLFGPKPGALAYNSVHSSLGPALLAGAAWVCHTPMLYPIAAIWFAHIGLDRLLGFGLKYPAGFGVTHLGVAARGWRRETPELRKIRDE